MSACDKELHRFMRGLRKRNPHEGEFHQAVEEVAESIMPWYLAQDDYREAQILERLTEPDRIVTFRVSWQTDSGQIRANRAWRVQFSHALGPYKGGLRFHPSVTQGILKFLGFEQIFKNSLTGLPMGGAKGGSNFNPKDKSRNEIMRFCQSMMTELHRHIGEDVDIPAGDIGVGAREISFLFGQYMRLANRWTGVLTGKGCSYGGSAVRTEATGYGCLYFCEQMLNLHGHDMADKRIAISGSGNVALHAAEKALEKNSRVVSLSDSSGTVVFKHSLNAEQLTLIKRLKLDRQEKLQKFAEQDASVTYLDGRKPWGVPCDIAMPCATQNEINEQDARTLIDHGLLGVCEGANMPCTRDATALLRSSDVLLAPGKAANAGGVAVSGLELSQNAMRISWPREEVDRRLRAIMTEIHERCVDKGTINGRVDYVVGANVAGIEKVGDAMLAYGVF